MRILFASSSSGSQGGGEIFLLYLASALREQGHTVGLWVSRHSRMDELATAFAAHGDVLRADYTNLYDTWHRGLIATPAPQRLARIRREWLAWRPDIVHVNKQCLEDGLDLLGAAAGLGRGHLATVHITQSARQLGARLAGLRDQRALSALRAYPGPLVAVAEARAAALRAFLGPGPRIETILNGVPPVPPPADRAALRAREGIPENTFAVVAVGRLEEQKRPLEFLRHLRRMRDEGLPVSGRWIGGGRLQSAWDAEVTRLDLAGIVRQDRWRHDVREVLSAFDVYLHPALFEGLPLALLEAMQAGLPCFVSPEVHADLPAEFEGAVAILDERVPWARVLGDRADLARRAEAGRKLARERYSTQAMAANYEALYRRLAPHA